MKNVLVTGSNGFLGRHVCQEFKNAGHNVYGVSRSSVDTTTHHTYQLDINDHAQLNNLVSEKSIDIIVHLAGKPIVQDCDKNPYDAFKVNGLGTASVLECARINNVSRVVSVETDKVYGFQKEIPTNETSGFNPRSPYEYSKFMAASLADFYRDVYELDVISVRPANLFGLKDFSTSRIIPRALNNLKQGQGIFLYETALKMKRDFVYVSDVAKALLILSEEKCMSPAYNISTTSPISMEQLADNIVNALDLKIPHVIGKKKSDFSEIPAQAIDGNLFQNEFGFEYTDFDTAIRDIWNAML